MFPLNPRILPFPLNNIYAHVNEDAEYELCTLLTMLFNDPPKILL